MSKTIFVNKSRHILFGGRKFYYLGEILLWKSFHGCINWDISFLEGKMTGREFGDFSQVFWEEKRKWFNRHFGAFYFFVEQDFSRLFI